MEREGFVFYKSFREVSKNLSDENRLKLFDRIIDYGIEGIDEKKEGISETFFILIKPQLDANNKKFSKGKGQGHHGKKGGRPRNNPNEEKTETPKGLLEKTPNVKEKEKVNVNDILSLHDNNTEEIKKFIIEQYGEEEIKMNTQKYKLIMMFIENGYNKIEKNKEGMDKFFDMMKSKSELYGYSPPNYKANRPDLLVCADKMFTRAKEKNHTIQNYLSQFNTFLEKKPLAPKQN